MGAFAAAMRDGRFSSSTGTSLGLKTVRGAVDHVVATFRENDRPNPTLDIDKRLAWTLARQFRAYSKEDPKAKQEKAIPICVIELIALKTSTESQCAISQLIIGAFFFVCRSCKCLKVPNQDQQLTKQLVLGNIVFYKVDQIIPHDCSSIFLADSVSTPSRRKRTSKNSTQSQSGLHYIQFFAQLNNKQQS
jgi:hypothetical protein